MNDFYKKVELTIDKVRSPLMVTDNLPILLENYPPLGGCDDISGSVY